jgi:hypothetical protein
MKNIKILGLATLLAFPLVSCVDKNKSEAVEAVDVYVAYVDSVKNVNADELNGKWDEIETGYLNRKIEAESSVENLENRMELDNSIAQASTNYEEYKAKWLTEKADNDAKQAKQEMRNTLFGGQVIGEDLNFDWVNKSNILKTYDVFVTNVSINKDKYSRENWDDIKMMYEALDTRKNTVEKEGLTTADNLKIAGLKTRFATMHTINRISAKSTENSEAKN